MLFVHTLEGWINDLSFASDVNELFVLPHSNSIYTYSVPETKDQQAVEKEMNWKTLPLLTGFYLNDNVFIAGGFDRTITVFQRQRISTLIQPTDSKLLKH